MAARTGPYGTLREERILFFRQFSVAAALGETSRGLDDKMAADVTMLFVREDKNNLYGSVTMVNPRYSLVSNDGRVLSRS